jgi:hypothetical protein
MDILGIGKLLGSVVNGFGERRDKKHGRKHDENMSDGKRITDMDDNDAAYAISQLKQQSGTWKDEYALFLVSVPAIMCFIKITWNDAVVFDGPTIVFAGFEALSQAPVWYQGLLVGVISAAAGINEYAKHQKRSAVSVAKVKAGA